MHRLVGVSLMIVMAAAHISAENWIQNGVFEAEEPALWAGGVIDHDIVHSGKGALRVDMPEGETNFSARYGDGMEVNQTEPETLMAAFWMRFEAKRQTAAVRGGVTFHVDFDDGPYLAWYGPFELKPEEMGSWVYHEARWKPKAPVAGIRPAVYMRGFEGSIYIDDLYLGPVVDLPKVERTTIPLSVTGSNGRFTQWPRFKVTKFEPIAQVFHLSGKNETNLELSCEIDVSKPAPVYLTSAWGSQYWTLYCPERKELAEIYTDERLDLSQAGRHTFKLPMNAFSDHGADLAPGGYVFVTERFKSFLIYSTEKAEGEPYQDARTGQTFNYWDTVKIERLSKAIGPSGVAAAFSLADLTTYKVSLTATESGKAVRVRPVLMDAQGKAVPLHGLALTGKAGDRTTTLKAEVAEDGVPTGAYLWPSEGDTPGSLAVSGVVRLATPEGMKEERIDQTVPVKPPVVLPASAPPSHLELLGWGSGGYAVSDAASNGPESMRRLVADAKAAGVRKLLVYARTSKGDYYPSDISLAEKPEWDQLKVAVEEGKKQGVEIYAAYILEIAQPVDLETHPSWAMIGRDGKPGDWYCYNNPEVRAFHAALLSEIVTKYDVAGVSLDFCRPGGGCFCPRCAAAFEAKYGKPLRDVDTYDPDRRKFERDSITDYMRELREAIRKARPDAKFSGYVWGRLGPEKDRAGQDWPRWLREGIMDFVCVGQYTTSTPMFRAQCHVLKQIADKYLDGDTSRIYPLIGISYIQGANPSYALADAVLNRHLWAARQEGMVCAGYFPFHSIRTHPETSAAHSTAAGR